VLLVVTLVAPAHGFAPIASRSRCTSLLKAAAVVITAGDDYTPAAAADVWQGFGPEDHERFLADYWQKRPLLIRQAFPG
jgi:hypothetical protein